VHFAIAAIGKKRNWRKRFNSNLWQLLTLHFLKNIRSLFHAIVPINQPGQQSEQHQHQLQVIDVYGQEIDCYHTCHHKFLLHGYKTRVCKCMSLWFLTEELDPLYSRLLTTQNIRVNKVAITKLRLKSLDEGIEEIIKVKQILNKINDDYKTMYMF